LQSVSEKEASKLARLALYRAECHITSARFFSNLHIFGGAAAAGLAAVASGTAFTAQTLLAGIFAILAAALTGLLTVVHPSDRAKSHQHASSEYYRLAGKLDEFLTFGASEQTVDARPQLHAPPPTVSEEPAIEVEAKERTPEEAYLALKAPFWALEAESPTVPVRLSRKTELWISRYDEWYPPRDDFDRWMNRKRSPRQREGVVAWLPRRLWRGRSR